jgi:hypothetical protein
MKEKFFHLYSKFFISSSNILKNKVPQYKWETKLLINKEANWIKIKEIIFFFFLLKKLIKKKKKYEKKKNYLK